jgi:ribosomal protein S18 acetylase RimI-like enzyme
VPSESKGTDGAVRIRLLEERALNCWPALRTEFYDGWVLRFADGYSRRSNSVNPLYPSTVDLPAKLRFCERRYRGAGQRVVFKLTSSPEHRELDSILAAEGYAQEAATSVQSLSLAGWRAEEIPGAAGWDDPAEDWLAAQFSLNAVAPVHAAIARRILERIPRPRRFFAIRAGGRIVACGLGMIDQGQLGIYDIVVDSRERRKGFGRMLMADLLTWGKSRGASNAVLQVMEDNPPALSLYARLGFREEYRYGYRSKE